MIILYSKHRILFLDLARDLTTISMAFDHKWTPLDCKAMADSWARLWRGPCVSPWVRWDGWKWRRRRRRKRKPDGHDEDRRKYF